MIDLASIRNASFTLTPTGYNPEEVDRFLADLADQLAESLSAPVAPEYEQAPEYEPNPQFDVVPEPDPQPAYEISLPAEREPADVDGLRAVIERTIGAMDSFVANELETLKSATELETEELLRERERMLDEAGEAAKAHLEETRVPRREHPGRGPSRRRGHARPLRGRAAGRSRAVRAGARRPRRPGPGPGRRGAGRRRAAPPRGRRAHLERHPRPDRGARVARARQGEPRSRGRPLPL